MRTIPIYHVDAFTSEGFTGNPAAVCLVDEPLEDREMQNIATEMNLSETAFVTPLGNLPFHNSSHFSLRWFTPKKEVPLCGHATLATSAVLFYEIELSFNAVFFHTLGGKLIAKKSDDLILLNFPSEKPSAIQPPEEILLALGIKKYLKSQNVKASKSVECLYAEFSNTLVVVLKNEKMVRELSPDFESLITAETPNDIQGVIVTSKATTAPYHFISRFFAPWLGINEDPVTGSAHTILTPYWAKKLHKKQMRASQVSERGGEMEVIYRNARVELIGDTVTILKGHLFL